MKITVGPKVINNKFQIMKANILYIFGAVVLLMNSCVEETPTFDVATPGDDVKFSFSLGTPAKTRTNYGDGIFDDTYTNSTIKVNWAINDQISVFGEDCLDGRSKANYTVTSSDGEKATGISKAGDAGVQWGTMPSRFYAVYPAVNTNKINKISDANSKISFGTSIGTDQANKFTLNQDQTTWIGTPYDKDSGNSTMPNAIMYSAPARAYEPGESVGMTFTPYSNVLSFTLAGWTPGPYNGGDILSIYSITLKAPKGTGIAGDFNIIFTPSNDGKVSVEATEGTQDNVTVIPEGGEIRLIANTELKFNIFTTPLSNVEIAEGWELELTTSHGNYAYPLNKANENDATTLSAGKIHKIGIPALHIEGENAADGPTNNWITRVPTNIYVSELSVPGAWYSSDPVAYQGGESISNLYSLGVRAFHIDCRLTKMGGDENYSLLCSGTDNQFTYNNGYHVSGPSVLSHLQTINGLVGLNPKEYVIVVITFAEKGIGTVRDPDRGNFLESLVGGANTDAESSVDPNAILEKLAEVLNDNSLTNLYGKKEGEKITSMTTINEVLGKFIVKINTSTTKFTDDNYPEVPNALLSFASLAPSNSGDITAGTFRPTSVLSSKMYWGKDETDLTYYYYQAQRTLSTDRTNRTYPSYNDRKGAINLIISKSDDIYEQANYAHNGWYQMGVGGFLKDSDNGAEDHEGLANELNSHLLEEVQKKLDEVDEYQPSPVGIVLMNYCKNETGLTDNDTKKETGLIRAIIKMNDKFKMMRGQVDSSAELQSSNPETKSSARPAKDSSITHWRRVY